VSQRTWPAAAGTSSRAVTVAPDEGLIARAAGLLAGTGYAGLAQLQFLDVNGVAALIDVNPRFYGSLPLALAAGVNLPAAWHAVASDTPPPVPGPYRVGVTYRWVGADLMAARHETVRPLLRRAQRPRAGAVWSSDDPVPSALLVAEAVWSRVGKRLPWRAGRPS